MLQNNQTGSEDGYLESRRKLKNMKEDDFFREIVCVSEKPHAVGFFPTTGF